MKLALVAWLAGAAAQVTLGARPPLVSTPSKPSAPLVSSPLKTLAPTAKGKVASNEKLDANMEKMKILAEQVQDVVANTEADNNGQIKGSVVDLVLQSISNNLTAVCLLSNKDFKTCAEGYQGQDCLFSKDAASFGNVNCIPVLSQCTSQLIDYCRSKVTKAEKCKSTDACGCANEAGCGWSRGHMMCLVGRTPGTCGDCPTMPRCGAVDCLKATRPCDCVALGGMCGWSTSEWRCVSGKDTDCNECPDQTECGGPGVELADSTSCPITKPAQLSPCKEVLTCPYNKTCCERCAGAKQVCNSVSAQCDGKYWEIITSDLTCPDCNGYYYDDGYYDDTAPTAPRNVTSSLITSTDATLLWKAPTENFLVGTDGYSVAYELASATSDANITIMDLTTKPTVTLHGLKPGTVYKVSILPVVVATEEVGEPAHFTFRTAAGVLAALKAKKAKVAKAAKAKVAKAAPPKASAVPQTQAPPPPQPKNPAQRPG